MVKQQSAYTILPGLDKFGALLGTRLAGHRRRNQVWQCWISRYRGGIEAHADRGAIVNTLEMDGVFIGERRVIGEQIVTCEAAAEAFETTTGSGACNQRQHLSDDTGYACRYRCRHTHFYVAAFRQGI